MNETKPVCVGCNRRPHQIDEYLEMAAEDMKAPDEWVKEEEGTYNPENGHFYCTECYVKAGSPLGVAP